jgi:hypothetical protein
MRLAREIVEAVRAACGERFIVVYRLSLIDLVEGGNTWEETVQVAQALEAAGVTMFNTGIGWHEARVPTIVTSVPRAAFAPLSARLKAAVKVPVIVSNRINTPEVAEDLLAEGAGDLVSLARPLLADPDFVVKTAEGRTHEINTCIACNQACLDHTFQNRRATCLVNPRAGRETELVYRPLASQDTARAIAVVGAGPAGLSAATRRRFARPSRDAVRCERNHRRTVQSRDARARQGRIQRDDPLFSEPVGAAWGRCAARYPRRCGAARSGRLPRRDPRHGHRAAQARRLRASTGRTC